MSVAELKCAVFLTRCSTESLTPENVHAAWTRSCNNRVAWPPEAILANTLPGSDEHYLRALITPEEVCHRYDQRIASTVAWDSFESPLPPQAHLIVSYVKDDQRLNIPPAYIHDRFIKAFEAAKDTQESATQGEKLREAVYLFQSTELSHTHRSAFTEQEIGDLFQLCIDNDSLDTATNLVEILKTTQDTPSYRAAITPYMAKQGFQFCLDRTTNPTSEGSSGVYAYQAILMLHHTIGDNRLRSLGGISDDQIGDLTTYYESVISAMQQDIDSGKLSFVFLPTQKINIADAKRALEYIEICTLSSPNDAKNLTPTFKMRAEAPQDEYLDRYYARRCLAALGRYPELDLV